MAATTNQWCAESHKYGFNKFQRSPLVCLPVFACYLDISQAIVIEYLVACTALEWVVTEMRVVDGGKAHSRMLKISLKIPQGSMSSRRQSKNGSSGRQLTCSNKKNVRSKKKRSF